MVRALNISQTSVTLPLDFEKIFIVSNSFHSLYLVLGAGFVTLLFVPFVLPFSHCCFLHGC